MSYLKFNITTLFCFVVFNSFSQVSIHSFPEEFRSQRYEVWVNDQLAPVFHAGLNTYFVSFDLSDKVEVRVLVNKPYSKAKEANYWQGQAQVKPLSKGINVQTEDSVAHFTLEHPGQFSLERPGTDSFEDEVLFIFANPVEKKKIKKSKNNIIYLGPGIHQENISLKNGQTLYLSSGAVLFGSINVWNAKNVSIIGRGTVVYYGPQSRQRDDGWKNYKNWHPLTTHNVQGLNVEGISFVNRSRTWTIQTHTTFHSVFDNIKIVASFAENLNGDGIDWYGGGNTRVVNSFIRSMDDCLAFFTAESSDSLWSHKLRTAKGTVEDVLVQNCVLWTTVANVLRLGWTGQNLITNNIEIKDCDVIHIPNKFWLAPASLICAVSPGGQGRPRHSNYRLENIHIEEPTALLGLQTPEAVFSNVSFKHIQMIGDPIPFLIQSKIERIEIEDFRVNGIRLISKAQLKFHEKSLGIEEIFLK